MQAEEAVQVGHASGLVGAGQSDLAAQAVVVGVAVGDAEVQAVGPAAQEELHEHLAARGGGLGGAHQQRRWVEADPQSGQAGAPQEDPA